jgi:trehalose 6-phosphate phosphatase
MRDVFDPLHRPLLRSLLATQPLIAFDYDGTLAPIADDPANARMSDSTRDLLGQLCERTRCIVISGRAQHDVLRRLRGVPVREVIGNHGLEPWRYSPISTVEIQGWIDALQPLTKHEGITIEDKIFSVAVHYRHAASPDAAAAAIREAVAQLPEVRVVGGKMVVNLLPLHGPNKGLALLKAKERFACESAIYVGDDETDEDVFGLSPSHRVFGVRVEQTDASSAQYFVRDQATVDDLLRLLLELVPVPAEVASLG